MEKDSVTSFTGIALLFSLRGTISFGAKRQGLETDLTCDWCRGKKTVYLFIHSPIRLHGIVLS
jgi:hypothetical protein